MILLSRREQQTATDGRIVIHGYLTGLSRPAQVVYSDRRVSRMGRSGCRQSQYSDGVGRKRCPQGRSRPAVIAPHGAGNPRPFVAPRPNAFLAVDDTPLCKRAGTRRNESHRFYAVNQIEYCRDFSCKSHFPIHRIFERSCEIGLCRLTTQMISEIFGVRVTKKLKEKLNTTLGPIEHGRHIFRAYFYHQPNSDARPNSKLEAA